MKKFFFIVGFLCLCLTPAGYAKSYEKGHYKQDGQGGMSQKKCDEVIAKLQKKQKMAIQKNNHGKARGLERAIEEKIHQCAGERAVSQYRQQQNKGADTEVLSEANTTEEKVKNLQKDAHLGWAEFMEDLQGSADYFSKEAEKGGDVLDDELDELLKSLKKMQKKVAQGLEDGAKSDMAKDMQKKLRTTQEKIRELLED